MAIAEEICPVFVAHAVSLQPLQSYTRGIFSLFYADELLGLLPLMSKRIVFFSLPWEMVLTCLSQSDVSKGKRGSFRVCSAVLHVSSSGASGEDAVFYCLMIVL